MENLNAEQVKKCLEVCSKQYKDDTCDKCPDCIYHNLGSNCVLQAVTDAHTLITSQEQRIKELTEENEKLKVIPEQMVERLKTYFGTFVLGYNIPLTEALKAVNQIAKEMLEGTTMTEKIPIEDLHLRKQAKPEDNMLQIFGPHPPVAVKAKCMCEEYVKRYEEKNNESTE